MSFLRARSDPPVSAVAALRGALRFASRVVVALIVFFCVLVLAIRFFVFPELESYRGYIAGVLERQIGQPVELDGLMGGWDGWNPRLDVRNLRVVDRTDRSSVLVLPRAA